MINGWHMSVTHYFLVFIRITEFRRLNLPPHLYILSWEVVEGQKQTASKDPISEYRL